MGDEKKQSGVDAQVQELCFADGDGDYHNKELQEKRKQRQAQIFKRHFSPPFPRGANPCLYLPKCNVVIDKFLLAIVGKLFYGIPFRNKLYIP